MLKKNEKSSFPKHLFQKSQSFPFVQNIIGLIEKCYEHKHDGNYHI